MFEALLQWFGLRGGRLRWASYKFQFGRLRPSHNKSAAEAKLSTAVTNQMDVLARAIRDIPAQEVSALVVIHRRNAVSNLVYKTGAHPGSQRRFTTENNRLENEVVFARARKRPLFDR